MNPRSHSPIVSMVTARASRRERELERLADWYVMQDELVDAIKALEILLELRNERLMSTLQAVRVIKM